MTANNCDVDKNENARATNVTTFDLGSAKTNHLEKNENNIFLGKLLGALPNVAEIKQYVGVFLCGITLWGTSWFLFKDAVLPDGYMFNMCGVVIAGYMLGHTIERYTTINPVVGMTLAGVLYRNFGPPNFLQNPSADFIDFHLRRIYPVIILTKGPLTWNWEYIKNNSVKVFSLATLPWIVECLSTAFFAHILLEYPWYWGLHLGSILASVSPAVVVPIVSGLHARGLGTKNQIALLVANAGGLDTAFTEGVCGVINSAIFYPAPLVYRIVKGLLAIFVGIALGIFWGVLSDSLPDHSDIYAPTIRSLLIFGGGVLLTYAVGYIGWGGTSGVAIMVCAGAAATRWARRDWPVANNPVWEVYKLLWRIFEPMLFTLSGYFLDVSQINVKDLCLILGCISSALVLRLLTAFLVALANDLSIKESLFIAVTWIPKAIVEAVLVRVAMDSLWVDATSKDRRIALQHSNIIVIAILITSTLGSALTTALGPVLLSHDSRVAPEDKNTTTAIDKGVYIIHNEDFKTTPELTFTYSSEKNAIDDVKKERTACIADNRTCIHYFILILLGLASWGLLWCAFGEEWSWNGRWFRPAVVAAIAWATGELLQMTTTLPPLLAAILTGITARNIGYLDMRHYTEIDGFMRKIYPVIILGKGSLGWNLSYMKTNWKQVASLGVLPWSAEVVTLAVCMNLLLGYPWLWGFLLGSIYASVSCPILMPTVTRLTAGKNLRQNWPQLICTAGGTDTALSVGVFGVIHSFIMYDGDDAYRYARAACALLLGGVVGAIWGSLAKFMPHSRDAYLTELRVLFVVIGGLFASFITTQFGWGGTGGIAVLACNATAARHWAKGGWKLNNNPASTAYRVMWSAVEPALFAYTGTFFVIQSEISKVMLVGFGILAVCLAVRLIVAFLVCSKLSIRERLFVCCTWVPKSIVEAVLCPVAINALIARGDPDDVRMEYAEHLMRLIVQAILITTPIGFLLTNHLGPILLKEKHKKCENESES